MAAINLQPAKLDLFLYRGTDWDGLTITLKENDGSPFDLAGSAIRIQIRDTNGGVLDELSSDNGRLVLGGVDGTILFHGSTDNYTFADAVYDARLTAEDGTHRVIFGGNVMVHPK